MADFLALAEARAAELLLPLNAMPEAMKIATLGARLDLFAARCLKVRTKKGGPLWPFVFNPIQLDHHRWNRRLYAPDKRLDVFRGIRDIIVKPRQLGFSTYTAAQFFMDGLRNPGRVTVVLSHDRDISEILLETYRLFWEHMPAELKEGLDLGSDTKYEFEIHFPDPLKNPPSKFIIDTEAGHPWRGGVIHNLHASEAAFYRNYAGYKASYVQGVGADGNVVVETTANGQNDFYQDALQAFEGTGRYRLVFYEWFRHPEYRAPWNPQSLPPDEEESALMGLHSLDLNQIAWRREKIAELGETFPQEYPETFLGAFLATGRPFFDQKAVVDGAEQGKALLAQLSPTHPAEMVTIYHPPIPGTAYMLSGDVAEGKEQGKLDISNPERGGNDFCAGYVTEVGTLRTMAAIHGRMTPPDFARRLEKVGRMYRACIAPERNNHGHTVVHYLENVGYPALYRHVEYDSGGNRFLVAGFPTDAKTRPEVVDTLADVVRTRALPCPDPGFWKECHTFVRNPKTGKPEALPNCHDDRVMGMGIGVYLCTLGRLAWGIEGGAASEVAGLPTDAWGTPAAPPVSGPAPAQASPLILEGGHDFGAQLAGAREELRKHTCGGNGPLSPPCIQFENGRCKLHRFLVEALDPACPSYYASEYGESMGEFGAPIGDDWG